jgi:hypothetical protein
MDAHKQETEAIPFAVREIARVRGYANVSPEDRSDSTPNSPETELNNSQLQKPSCKITMPLQLNVADCLTLRLRASHVLCRLSVLGVPVTCYSLCTHSQWFCLYTVRTGAIFCTEYIVRSTQQCSKCMKFARKYCEDIHSSSTMP